MSTTIETFTEYMHAGELVLKPPRRPRLTSSMRRKRAYVCHASASGGGAESIEAVRAIARAIIDRGDVPVVPQLFFDGIVDEQAEPDLALGLRLELVALSDELYVYGLTITARMKKEIDCALELGIAIRFMELAS